MISNRVSAAALLMLALVVCSWNYAGAEGEDCCLTTKNKRIPHRLVKSFYIQSTEMGCRVSATVFITKKDIKLCAPLPTKNNWVKKLSEKLKNKSHRKPKGKKH